MGEFVKGVLERNEDGATYEGVVYDRNLTVRVSSERALSVFDPEALSMGLPTGNVYELLLQPLMPITARYFRARPASLKADDSYGQVVALDWRAHSRDYKRAIASLDEHRWILLATAHGQILVSSGEITMGIEIGDYVQWQQSRLDLVAVV